MRGPVFITGATGFLGGALLDRLLTEGLEVRALVRDRQAAERLRARGVRPVLGDLGDGLSLVPEMAGCGLLYHLAGVNQLCPRDPGELLRVNLGGTVRVLEEAARAGVSRVVYTSSAATLGEPKGEVGDEQTVHRGSFLSIYERSKYLAERAALAASDRLGLPLICLNPASVQGPGRTSGTARWLIRYANGQLRWLIHTRVSLVDIADCTEAHLAAATRGRPGERYVISGPSAPIEELIGMVAEVTGRSYPVHFLPAPPAVALGSLLGVAFRLSGRSAPVCREMLRTLAQGHAYDGGKAARELGFAYTPLAETVRRAVSWYAERGYLNRPLAQA